MKYVCTLVITAYILFLLENPLHVHAEFVSLYEAVTITAVVPTSPLVVPFTTPTSTPPSTIPTISFPGVTNSIDSVTFRGLGHPSGIISLLKNGVVVAETPVSPNGTFQIGLRGLLPGTYSFGIRGEDQNKLKSTLDLYTVELSDGITTTVEGIFLSPTITSDKIEVKRGDAITFLGYTAPNATITVTVPSPVLIQKKVTADSFGAWFYKLDSSNLALGIYASKARANTSSTTSSLSDPLNFIVSTINKIRTPQRNIAVAQSTLGSRTRCDLNNDNKVNILDFSIMAFWYKRIGFPKLVDLNQDGKVNLTDLSILAYCWTG